MTLLQRMIGFILSMLVLSAAYAQTPEGLWVAVDDQTGQKRAVVDFRKHGNIMSGTIIKVFAEPGDTGFCRKCPGIFKDKPIIGLKLVWGLRENMPGVWEDGHILDAKNGKIYRLRVQVKNNQLYLRGYIGIAILGKTQLWQRPNSQDLQS